MITRRQFVQQGSLLTAAALLTNSTDLFKMHKVLGIQLYTVRSEVDKDLDNAIAQVAKAGYSHVELYGYSNRKFFGRTVQQMADLLKKNNLVTPSGHYGLADFLYEPNYNWDSWKYLIEDAKLLEHSYIVIPHIDDKHRTADDFKRIADRLNKGGELAQQAGLHAGYHNHDFEFNKLGDTTGLEILLSNTDEKLVKFEMDIYWVVRAGNDPLEWFRRHPGRFTQWHIKDMAKTTDGSKGQTCEVGSGIIDFKQYFKKQKKAGLDYAYVEQEQYTRPVFECIKTSADYMKAHLI